MEKGREIKSIRLIAVEVSMPCRRHRLVLARVLDAHSWLYFFVREPSWIEFGDLLLYCPATQGLHLSRGPDLVYHARLDTMPEDLVLGLIERLPYKDIYPDGPVITVLTPPQK